MCIWADKLKDGQGFTGVGWTLWGEDKGLFNKALCSMGWPPFGTKTEEYTTQFYCFCSGALPKV